MDIRKEFEVKVYDTAVGAAMAAGEIIKKYFHGTVKIEREFAHDLKLEADRLTESAIIKIIEENFPDHSIITEESGIKVKSGEYCWIIDPLDGSVNYFYGIPYFCTCIACYKTAPQTVKLLAEGKHMVHPGEPVCGVVYAPISGELYTAVAGGGAYRNGTRIKTGAYQKLSEAMAIMTAGGAPALIDEMICIIKIFAEKARKVRMFGATGLDIVHVAAGSAGVFLQKGAHLWDCAASQIILEEAGGDVELIEGEPGRWDIIATAPGITDEVASVLGKCGFYRN